MPIEALKAVQRAFGLRDTHLVHLGEEGFTLAHTDDERASNVPLMACPLHLWLSAGSGPPVPEPGLYVVPPAVDQWDFTPLMAAIA